MKKTNITLMLIVSNGPDPDGLYPISWFLVAQNGFYKWSCCPAILLLKYKKKKKNLTLWLKKCLKFIL